MSNEVIGWIMAWQPKNCIGYNFEFFAETGASGELCKYSYNPFGTEDFESPEVVQDVSAMKRADFELNLLKSGKTTKYGMEVIDGYIMPVMAKRSL